MPTFFICSFGTDLTDRNQVFDEAAVMVGMVCGSFASVLSLFEGVIRLDIMGCVT